MLPNVSLTKRGFTLLELLVSLAVGSLVILIILASLLRGSKDYKRIDERRHASLEARSALHAIANDLRSATWDSTSLFYQKSQATWPEDSVGFFLSKPRSSQSSQEAIGDMCYVYYYTAITADQRGVSRKLFRQFISSQKAFELLKNKSDPLLIPPTNNPEEDEPIAFDIAGIRIEPFYYDSQKKAIAWSPTHTSPPDYIDITLFITDKSTRIHLVTGDDWKADTPIGKKLLGTPDKIHKNPHIRSFFIRIFL